MQLTDKMLIKELESKDIILASQSPRRHRLLEELKIPFTVQVSNADETYDDGLYYKEQIPMHLADKKAEAIELKRQDQWIIAADTIVWLDHEAVNKPGDLTEAFNMLQRLSGNVHEVITGVCLRSLLHKEIFYSVTQVFFNHLSEDEIHYYVNNFQPLDKAGAYGIQEWIGYMGVERIEGSYFNVMGLPVEALYSGLKSFASLHRQA